MAFGFSGLEIFFPVTKSAEVELTGQTSPKKSESSSPKQTFGKVRREQVILPGTQPTRGD
jgi:hypothetical protein